MKCRVIPSSLHQYIIGQKIVDFHYTTNEDESRLGFITFQLEDTLLQISLDCNPQGHSMVFFVEHSELEKGK